MAEEKKKKHKGEMLDPSTVNSISLTDVNFSYRSNPNKTVLRDINLTLQRGEVVALVGKNGSGKTTIASMLAGLYQPKSGTITILDDGTDYNS